MNQTKVEKKKTKKTDKVWLLKMLISDREEEIEEICWSLIIQRHNDYRT